MFCGQSCERKIVGDESYARGGVSERASEWENREEEGREGTYEGEAEDVVFADVVQAPQRTVVVRETFPVPCAHRSKTIIST